eukprot:g8287.t1
MDTSTKLPSFSFSASKYDMSTFLGRSRFFYETTSPFTLLTSKATLESSISLLKKFREGTVDNDPELKTVSKTVLNSMLWDARSVTDSILHPDTQKPLNPFFRFSFFVPANLLIMPFMLHPSTIASAPRTIGVHILNQSYNAGVNYENRNASNDQDNMKVFQGYLGAVTSSVGIALVATAVTNRADRFPRAVANALRIGLPFAAVASAGSLNLALVRRDELYEGISVFDRDKNEVGKSPIAARNSIIKCSLARFAWCTPIMVFPPVIALQAEKIFPILKKNTRVNIAFMTVLYGAHLFFCVPPALGLFPQYDSMATEALEPEFHHLKYSDGSPIKELFFNKGL